MRETDHNPRILSLASEHDLRSEFDWIGVEPEVASRLLAKSRHYALRIDRMRGELARRLAEAARDVGAGLALSRKGSGPAFLIGSEDQIRAAAAVIGARQGPGGRLAAQMEKALKGYSREMVPLSEEILPDPKARWLFEEMAKRTLVMGILNVTPDSFSDGGEFLEKDSAVARGIEIAEQGADIIDVGGESTRPWSDPVPIEEEIRRVVPVVERLAKAALCVSVDTYRAETARVALDAGACIVNDISAFASDPAMSSLVAERKVPAVLMHMKGTPRDMQQNPVYDDLIGQISAYLRERIAAAVSQGVDERVLIIDPGFGFGKLPIHNLEILRRLREFTCIGRPILVGTSRKSTIGHVLGGLPPEERLEGTAATVAIAIANGASIVRVHDVKEMARVARMTDAIIRGR